MHGLKLMSFFCLVGWFGLFGVFLNFLKGLLVDVTNLVYLAMGKGM